jgi:hypothetical protein
MPADELVCATIDAVCRRSICFDLDLPAYCWAEDLESLYGSTRRASAGLRGLVNRGLVEHAESNLRRRRAYRLTLEGFALAMTIPAPCWKCRAPIEPEHDDWRCRSCLIRDLEHEAAEEAESAHWCRTRLDAHEEKAFELRARARELRELA